MTADNAAPATPVTAPSAESGGLHRHPLLLLAGAGVLLLALVGGVGLWLYDRQFEATDDAFIDTHIVRLAPQVAGRINRVLIADNQQVAAGQVLVLINPADSQARMAEALAESAQAAAALSTAQAQIGVSRASANQAQADATAAAAQAGLTGQDLARYRALARLNPAAVAQVQLDQALASARQAAAQLAALRQAVAVRAQQITAARTQVVASRAMLRGASARLHAAGLDLGYTRILAPIAGHIAQNSAALGNYVQPGTQIMAIVPLNLWVTANFKETQLTRMRPRQTATVRIDACPGVPLAGHVDSIQRGAGQAFAILPAENATGNYVKVVQRVPVKITLDHPPQGCLLGPGMSVTPTVRVR